MEGADVDGGLAEDIQEFGGYGCHGLLDFLGGDLQGGQVGLVELLGVGVEGLVAVLNHVGDDAGHHALYVGGDIVTGEDLVVGNLAVLVNLNHGFLPGLSYRM